MKYETYLAALEASNPRTKAADMRYERTLVDLLEFGYSSGFDGFRIPESSRTERLVVAPRVISPSLVVAVLPSRNDADRSSTVVGASEAQPLQSRYLTVVYDSLVFFARAYHDAPEHQEFTHTTNLPSQVPTRLKTYVSHPGGTSKRRSRVTKGGRSKLEAETLRDNAKMGYECLEVLSAAVNVGKGTCVVDRLKENYSTMLKCNGVNAALKMLKDESSKARQSWVQRGIEAAHLAQVSFLGRSLPVGSKALLRELLFDHHNNLSTREDPENDALFPTLRRWAEKWAKRKCLPSHRAPPADLPSYSACYECKAVDGGLRGFTMRLGLHPNAEALYSNSSLNSQFPVQDIQSLVTTANLCYHAKDLSISGAKSKAVAISERGLKGRVVTKSSAYLHYAGHVVRKRLLGGLRKETPVQSVLEGVDDSKIIAGFVGAKAEICISTDMKNATDLLSHESISALVDGLCSSGRFTELEVDALRACTGPQWIEYPQELKLPPFMSQRGILMGLPTTWTLLSLIHLFWWEEAVRIVCRRNRRPYSEGFADNRFVICGDDALMVGQKDVAMWYGRLMGWCGGRVSPGKHFECFGKSFLRGVFIERLYSFHVSGGRVTGGARNSAIPLRSFVRPDSGIVELLRQLPSTIGVPNQLKLMLTVGTIADQHPGGRDRIIDVVERVHPWLYNFAKGLGLTNGIPIRYGGSGLPVRDIGRDTKVKHARGILAAESGIDVVSLMRGQLNSTWQLAVDMANFDMQGFIADGTFVVLPSSEPSPAPVDGANYVLVGSERESSAAIHADAYMGLAMTIGDDYQRPRKHILRALRRAIKTYNDNLPPLEEDAVDVIKRGVRHKNVWVRRTRGPDNKLLYPRWVKEHKATEALARSVILRAVRLSVSAGENQQGC
jgi:hypothetical protein